MTYSEIKITFNEDLDVGTFINVQFNYTGSPGGYMFVEQWTRTRQSTNQVGKGFPTANPGERSAINFVSSFLLDYNVPVNYEVSRLLNVITIKCLVPEQMFVSGSVNLIGEVLDTVDFEITNFTGTVYKLIEQSFSQATTSPCTRVRINIETSVLTTNILSPVQVAGNTSNPFSFNWYRGQSASLVCENEDGEQLTLNVNFPDALNVANFTLSSNTTPNGGTLSIDKINSNGLNIEYSLDGEDWQVEPFFNGLIPDDYTLYVRDQYGCSFSTPFLISEFNISDPYFYLSKSNSIRYAERIDFNAPGNYKTDDNSLSCEADVQQAYKEIQQYESGDSVKTQLKSNYSENTAKVIRANGAEVNVPVYKLTNNIGNKERRDAVIYKYNNTKSGIFFINGNIYDFDTNAVTGSYLLNGGLPNWAKAGSYIQITNVWYQIEHVIFDENRNADVLIISLVSFFPFPTSVIVGSIFNIQNYEVYEFSVDMADYNDESITVRINANDGTFADIVYLSEEINIKSKQVDALEIRYYNIDNNDIFYQTGIRHLIRLPFTIVEGRSDDASDTNKTDSSVILLNATIYEGDEFTFEPVTKQMMRKILIALSHKFVYLDGVGYVKDGDFEVEGPLEKSNLYVVKAKMLKTGKVYTNINSGPIQMYDDEMIEIPGMVEWDGGFIRQ